MRNGAAEGSAAATVASVPFSRSFALNAEVNFNVLPPTHPPNCCYTAAAMIAPKRANVSPWLRARVCGCHYASIRGEDDAAVKLSIKYSSSGSQMSFLFFFSPFFSFPVSYRARRQERSFLCSQAANEGSCMRSHEFLRTVFND